VPGNLTFAGAEEMEEGGHGGAVLGEREDHLR